MVKTFANTIKETQNQLARICNNSGLSPIILELILQNLCSEIRLLVKEQLESEKEVEETEGEINE